MCAVSSLNTLFRSLYVIFDIHSFAYLSRLIIVTSDFNGKKKLRPPPKMRMQEMPVQKCRKYFYLP